MQNATDLPYPEPTDEQRAAAAALRERADDCHRRRLESIERSDTDGFLSQWAQDMSAREYHAQAEILLHGGVEVFEGLYRRSDGKRARAKLIQGRYGWCWAFCDANDNFTGQFLSDSKGTPRSKMWREGYEKRDELAPAKAKLTSNGTGLSGSCWVITVRTDGGYPEDAVVV